MRIGNSPRPDRYLRVTRRWLPDIRLRAQTDPRKQNPEGKDKRFHPKPEVTDRARAVKHMALFGSGLIAILVG